MAVTSLLHQLSIFKTRKPQQELLFTNKNCIFRENWPFHSSYWWFPSIHFLLSFTHVWQKCKLHTERPSVGIKPTASFLHGNITNHCSAYIYGMSAILPSSGTTFIVNPQLHSMVMNPGQWHKSQHWTWELSINSCVTWCFQPFAARSPWCLIASNAVQPGSYGREVYEFRRSRSRYIMSDTREVCDSKGSDVRIISWVIKIYLLIPSVCPLFRLAVHSGGMFKNLAESLLH